MTQRFVPTRTAGLEQLTRFLPRSGRDYAAKRNYDLPDEGHPHVSQLSPHLRHRLLTEADVLQAVLGRYSLGTAEKFVQEVCWRTYWKGWLELRPQVWADYLNELQALPASEGVDPAMAGQTDIPAFNGWVRELVDTGYLHNHARMWFASIWIFTLGLPWQAGADFFLRHLLDGDPASNTLSWRWVAGLQTRGKHYLARPANISKYTQGRHGSDGALNTRAEPLDGPPHPPRRDPPKGDRPEMGLRTGILLHDDDLSPEFLLNALDAAPIGHAGLLTSNARSPHGVSASVRAFSAGAVDDALGRWSARLGPRGPVTDTIDDLADWARAEGLEQVVTAYAPVGPNASALRRLAKLLSDDGITVKQVLRPWDADAWPHATHGFFRFKKTIPDLVSDWTGSER